ncbi:putative bifunctional diguanylate cyclase/phosphodiesterase [Quadrisphaera granulorum]|uniref:putative bifunctional diguanylate cyclase/phosphodiesterase n=1 Tax=Quadrisphaera granulorum TaxID=317664 RepID=UPI0014762022|nr:EAL domain-containing protein [Quadrisphaera granulorum]
MLDPSAGTVVEANQTFWDWTGLDHTLVVGTAFARLLPIGDRILWSTHCLPKLDAAGHVEEVSLEVLGAGGVRRAAFLTASRLQPVAGPAAPHDGGAARGELVLVALFGASARRRYEEDLLAAKRRAEASEERSAQAEAGLKHLAHHDQVTGLLNRRGLDASLLAVLSRGEEQPAQGTLTRLSPPRGPVVFFIDLDGFKQVNDSIGHAGGDALLVEVAERLRATTDPAAVLARFAGDEFIVVDPLAGGDDDAVVADVCDRLLAALARPVVIGGVEVLVSASIGVARSSDDVTQPREPEARAEALLSRADAAMYQVKRSGRSGWRVHDPAAADPVADRLRLLEQLRHGIAEGQLRLHHQPRVELATGSTTGVEAGVAQAAAWNAAGRHLEMSINVSARQLADPDLPRTVASVLARHGVPASQLVLEITETALMLDPDAAATTLGRLVDLGARIAVDDFGTGYASLTYLRRFPVHELKVARSFVAGVARDAGDRAIVTGCIQLAHALGLTSVAEGVETVDQRDVLTELGCHVGQGYLFSKPVPAEALRW